jgi:Glycosyltransferase family 87
MSRSLPATARPRAAPAPAVAGAAAPGAARPWKALVLACLGLAALSLLGPAVPTYDPWAWIIWGREITHLDLNTVSGPSWKPLPILFTTPFALLGDAAAPGLWLLIARAGGLLAIAMAYRLGSRLGGRAAGLIAGAALVLAEEFVRNFARGNSEGLLVALCLWAVERHLDGRRTDAFLLGFGAALLRPEVWPFWGLYGLWLAYTQPRRRLAVAGAFVLCGFLWFAPEYWGSGDWLRAANRARQPNPDSPAFAPHPFLEVFKRSSTILSVPVLLGALLALVPAARARRWDARVALAAAALALMIAVALMTQAGFAGNLRYVALPAALVCVLAGVGWVDAVRAAWRRGGRVAAAALAVVVVLGAVPFLASNVDLLSYDARKLQDEAYFYDTLPVAIDKAGGRERIKRCGTVFTGPFQVQVVAWNLHMHGGDVEIEANPPGIVVAAGFVPMARDRRFKLVTQTRRWVVRRACAR